MSEPAAMSVVSRQVALTGRWVFSHRKFWLKMGRLESRALQERLEQVSIKQPVFVTGLARAGTTILLELLADHPQVATHKYQDYPFVFIPFWWEQFVRRARGREVPAAERAHGDGIFITPKSPEAMEEPIWMSFFPHLHDPCRSNVLDEGTSNAGFESFYMNNIRKVLLRSDVPRYVAKGNYNITRLRYITKLFPDARFVVPVRSPASHVASLRRQHQRFLELAAGDAEVVRYFGWAGHFEFGPDRRPIHTGDDVGIAKIRDAWDSGDEIGGWAWSWRTVHEAVLELLGSDPAWRRRLLLVPYEEFCADPGAWIPRIMAHAGLDCSEALLGVWRKRIRPAPEHGDEFSREQMDLVRRVTAATAERVATEMEGEKR